MKNFVNTASLFAKHGANIAFNIVLALFIFATLCAVEPGMIAFAPHVAALSVAVYLFTHSFTGKRASNMAFSPTQYDIFNLTQLQKKNIVMSGIYNHYGWKQDANGQWQKGSSGRDLPKISDDLRLVRHDLYTMQYLTIGTQQFDFFLQQGVNNVIPDNNFDYATLPMNKLYLFAGIVSELATGASAADTADLLLFGQPVLVADAPVLNSQVTFKINGKEEITRVPFKNLFINDDAVKGMHRFEEAIVWEPGSQIQFSVKLAKAYGAGVFRYLRVSLVGIELTV